MTNFSRREFFQASIAASLLAAAQNSRAASSPAKISEAGGKVQVKGKDYAWEWSQPDDQWRLLDRRGMEIAHAQLQPAVVVQSAGPQGGRVCVAGKPVSHAVHGNSLTIRYQGVNRGGELSLTWRFDDDGFWLDPIDYKTPNAEDVVSLNYFAQGTGESAAPSLASDYLVLPGTNESSQFSPILTAGDIGDGLHQTGWLGHSWTGDPDGFQVQAWGLPAHYFCGFHRSPYDFQKTPAIDLHDAEPRDYLDAFCCGLAELPNADMLFEMARNRFSPIISYRSDLWRHLRGPGSVALGSRLYWTVGANFYEAIREYYLGLVRSGVIQKKSNSAHKNDVALAPSFCTYGEEVARDRVNEKFDEATLIAIYEEMKQAKFKAKLFAVDGYWEGKYGSLRHSEERFPHFEETLERIRSEGHYLGLWAAFMRCQDPAELGLTTANMLRTPDGKPFAINHGTTSSNAEAFYIMDCSQPEVQRVLRDMAKRFTRRYRPDFVKFDFGYELPALTAAAPRDMSWAGERMLLKAMQLVVGAMREVNPDIVVLYYSLSPLLIDVFDLNSPDDLGFCSGDFDLEANRRFFFSSLLGEIGMPTWSSTGYDWRTAPGIWFDVAALGTPGSLLSFSGPQAAVYAKPEWVAKYNGVAQAIRNTAIFSALPIDAAYYGPARGARSSSWARVENGEIVVVALREHTLDGHKGAGRFRDLVSSDTSIVVASKTNDGIERSSKLAVVPFGTGTVTIKHEGQAPVRAVATERYINSESRTRHLTAEGGAIRIPVREQVDDGSIIEWIEVDVFTT